LGRGGFLVLGCAKRVMRQRRRDAELRRRILARKGTEVHAQRRGVGKGVWVRKDTEVHAQRHRGASAELGRVFYSRKDTGVHAQRRGVGKGIWERKGTEVHAQRREVENSYNVTQRRKGAELGRVFGNAKAPGCKRGGGKGDEHYKND
jgi:hypothetical protein